MATQLALNLVQKMYPQVTSIVDGKKSVLIEVTTKDANSKGVKDHKTCALAVACQREFGLDGVVVSRTVAYLVKGKMATRYRIPQSAQKEIVAFDRGANFEPGQYQLNAIPKSMKFGASRDTGKHETKRKVKRPMFRHTTEGVRTSLLSV